MVPYGTLAKLPIGAVTLGGITPEARPGNPQPRLFVDEENEGIVNFMGLNNSGAELWAAQIRFEREILGIHHPPLIANIANDPATPMEKKPEEAKKLAIIL
jgi:dihydroorotate dehydrogenase